MRLQRLGRPYRMRLRRGMTQHGFIEQCALRIANLIDCALTHAGVDQTAATLLDLRHAMLPQLFAILGCGLLLQLHDQQVAVLQQGIDIHDW